jgi:general secretion pathway protein L
MADTLLIRLSRDPDAPVSWLVADNAGRMVTAVQEGALLQAADLAPGRRVCVLVPAADVIITEVDVPIKSGAKIQQVVPFALEEQLAEDIETLHFALGRRASESGRTPVAVIARALIDGWLAALHAAGLEPDALYPESELIPANPGQAVALLDGDGAILRQAGGLPVTLPLDALSEALELMRPAKAAGAEPPEHSGGGLVLYTGAAEWQQHARQVEAVRDRFDGIKVQLLTDGPLVLFAQQLPHAAREAINLRQGPYAPASAAYSGWRAWRVAAMLLAALVVLHAVGSAAELMVLHRSERTVDASIEETFRQAMPGEHNATHARPRMEARLMSMHEGPAGSGLLAALGALAQARGSAPGTTVQNLTFREGMLEMKLTAPNADALDRISQAMQANGWQAQLISGNSQGSNYEGRIQIKPRA